MFSLVRFSVFGMYMYFVLPEKNIQFKGKLFNKTNL